MPLWPKCASRKTWDCAQCPKRLVSAAGLRQHLQVHQPEPSRTCAVCGLKTRWQQSLTRHYLQKHSSWFAVYCTIDPDHASYVRSRLYSNTAYFSESEQAKEIRVAKRKRAAAKKTRRPKPPRTFKCLQCPRQHPSQAAALGCTREHWMSRAHKCHR
jgi:transcription elongation factor Elf1